MGNTVIRLLKLIDKKGEVSLSELSKLIPKNYNDHRDFYPIAFLVSNNLLDDEFFQQREQVDLKEQLLAREFYACHSAGKSASDGDRQFTAMGNKQKLSDQKFALSAQGHIYLSDYRTRRNDRLSALATGIVVGIITSLVTIALS
ncbi:hypothetical protein FJQ87_05660 [Shewanella sp. SNU WT4]|uniref:hypothetical protein n=1 Tax=Shewanella sp. SNU WT4 TaxID=2590015 RepID=UPI00112B5458|nr:hypothetical protein [Shewanella sp. SNU WT4]QDF66247.1 hypothetical protein FJQ87_05660 [Shewanella sp. SNU WT4]